MRLQELQVAIDQEIGAQQEQAQAAAIVCDTDPETYHERSEQDFIEAVDGYRLFLECLRAPDMDLREPFNVTLKRGVAMPISGLGRVVASVRALPKASRYDFELPLTDHDGLVTRFLFMPDDLDPDSTWEFLPRERLTTNATDWPSFANRDIDLRSPARAPEFAALMQKARATLDMLIVAAGDADLNPLRAERVQAAYPQYARQAAPTLLQ